MINSKIISGKGKPYNLKVDKEGTIGVVIHPHPPQTDETLPIPFSLFFKDGAGSSDMRVAATLAAPVMFSINAEQDRDVYIKTISFEIADASATLSKFGNIAALTNGVKLQWFTSSLGTVDLSEELKTNWDFIRLCGGNPGFGDGVNAFRASNVSGSSEGYIPFLDVGGVFGVSYGIKIRAGSTDRLTILVQDNTSAVDAFNAIAYGTKINLANGEH